MFNIRIAKNGEQTNIKKVGIRLVAVFTALIMISIFLLIGGYNPLEVFGNMILGAFKSKYSIREVIIKATPILIASLGILIAFKMKFWNIGAEGQITMGAFAASFVALNFGYLHAWILIPVMMLFGIIMGGIWSGVPAYFKSKFGTNETIFTLMMNYIAIKWITYLQYGPWKDPDARGFPRIADFTKNGILPKFLGIHIGVYIAIIIAVGIYIYINYTKKGYEIRVIGESKKSAEYAGMSVGKILIFNIFLSGAICGIAGAIQASGVNKSLDAGIAAGNGFSAIIVAWLSNLNAGVMVVISIIFAAMIQGGAYIQMMYGIPQSAAEILQGTILFFVLGGEFFIKYRVVLERRGSKN